MLTSYFKRTKNAVPLQKPLLPLPTYLLVDALEAINFLWIEGSGLCATLGDLDDNGKITTSGMDVALNEDAQIDPREHLESALSHLDG